jgi:hypothetical protein
MPRSVSRRTFLRQAALGAAVGVGTRILRPPVAAARGKGPQLYGVGRIGRNLDGVTIPSPSDFGFTADASGGNFVCSMFGAVLGATGLGAPGTGGFKGCNIMTVQGLVVPGSVQVHRGTASFAIEVSIFAQPDVFTFSGPILNIGPLPGTIQVKLGGPGKATMVMHIPAVTEAVGGDTGGIVEFGRIEKRRVEA